MPCEKNCNQGRLCPANNGRGRTCDELGVCQSRPGRTCDELGVCQSRPGRTCDELGVCQSRPGAKTKTKASNDTEKLPPGGHWFSPGSLDGPYQDTKRVSARRVAVALYLAVGTAAAVAVAGFAAGYFNIPGMLR